MAARFLWIAFALLLLSGRAAVTLTTAMTLPYVLQAVK
jgi:hypothetical protein